MTLIHGFELLREQYIAELKTTAKFFRHAKTGAELLSLSNEDENKVFGITFRTPPADSTGVAHILEHSVLCGSRKYPVKEPFVELLKGSLKTFLNAFTYPDKTCYPVASQNVQDFYNLIDVYLDAVFYPRLTEFIFQQEGWHFELESRDNPLIRKGVVYSEMKGAYSSPDRLLVEYSQQSLFPDNTYGLDSGGDPKQIIHLTYEQFRRFHAAYYHPSNARIYFYGDDDPEHRLRLLNEYLDSFDRAEVDSTIPLQPPFSKPMRIVQPFDAGEAEEGKRKGMLTVNWLLSETTEIEKNLALHILEYILLGMPGSPLRKALIDSGLGEDLAGVGLEGEVRQMFFSIGLKGIDVKDADRIETLILQTLELLAKEGIDPHTVEAALNTIEFRLRENNTGHFPRGLVLMLRALTTWLYGGDPTALIAFEAPFESVKSRLASDKFFFEKLIRDAFLNNMHRTTLILEPDPLMGKAEEVLEKDRMVEIRKSMSPEQLEEVMEQTHRLRQMQKIPDPPEALAKVPSLKLTDLDKKNKTIPLVLLEEKGVPVLYHDLPTNGIVYLDLGFDLHTLPQRYLPYVSLFGRALLEMGTEEENFVTLSQRISRKTGGIVSSNFTSVTWNSRKSEARLFLRGKAMADRSGDLMNILQDVLLTVRLDNRERFRQMVLEEKARREQGLVSAGHQAVDLRMRAHFNEADWAAEQMRGVSYVFFLRTLAEAVDKDWSSVLAVLESMKQILVNRKAVLLNVTADESDWSHFRPHMSKFLDALPEEPIRSEKWSPKDFPRFEGMTVPTQVNYVGKGIDLYASGYRFHGSALVITRYLRNSWLWDQIRVQGGAYGAFCILDRFSGVLTFVSYRDPNLLKTLDAFDQSAQFLIESDLSEEELTKNIIGAIGDIDSYLLPDARGHASMLRYLMEETDEIRQRMREEVLETSVDDFRTFGRVLREAGNSGLVKILGSQSAFQDVLAEKDGWLEVFKLL